MHRVYDPASQMYRNMNAREAEAEADRLLVENERLRAAGKALALVVSPNDNGHTRCLACSGNWHTEDPSRHAPRCPVRIFTE